MSALLAMLALSGCTPDVADDAPTPSATGSTADTGPVVTGRPPLQFRGPPPRNILMVSIDTLRRDHLDRWSELGLMPWLDEQMTAGVVLDAHRTCSNWTFMGATCTLLGAGHVDNGFLPRLNPALREPFPADTPFLATHLRDAGWHTGLFSANYWLSGEWGTAQGYQGSVEPVFEDTTTLLRQARRTVLDWQEADDAPWLMHVHVMEPHAPYNPPPEYLDDLEGLDPIRYDLSFNLGHYQAVDYFDTLPVEEQEAVVERMRVRYHGELRYLDDQLRDGLATWRDQGLLDDTLVVIWNDHGEALREHDHIGHAYDLHAEENDGFVVFVADRLEPAAWAEPTHAIDLAPTLLELAGVPVPDTMTGLPVGTAPPDRPLFSLTLGREGAQSAVELDGHKLLFDWDTGTPELYDREVDLAETVDRYAPDHPQVQALWSALRPQIERAAALAPEHAVSWPTDLP